MNVFEVLLCKMSVMFQKLLAGGLLKKASTVFLHEFRRRRGLNAAARTHLFPGEDADNDEASAA